MKTYELTYIISPEITSEEAEATAKEIESFIQNKGCVVLVQKQPVAKTLAYPIKSHASGFMVSIEFQSEPDIIKEIKDDVNKHEKIVRHIIAVKKPVRVRKERGAKSLFFAKAGREEKTEDKGAKEQTATRPHIEKEKIELKDIEQKLNELLGE